MEKGDDNIKKILRNAVTLENKEFYCNFLKKLIAELNKSTMRYHGTSILLIKGPKRSDIRWVDFHYWRKYYVIQTISMMDLTKKP